MCAFISTEKGREWKGRGPPEASNQLLHVPQNSSSRTLRAYIKNRKFKPWFTCVISRLVPVLCVCVWVAGWHSNSISSLTYHNCMFKCLQRHFSGWYSVVLDQRLRMGKTMALYDWKRKLRAWRAWRAVVWAEQKQREVVRTEQELRAENRREPKRQYFLSIFLADTHWFISSQSSNWGLKASHLLRSPDNARWLWWVTEGGCYGDVWLGGSYGVGWRRNNESFWPSSRRPGAGWLP